MNHFAKAAAASSQALSPASAATKSLLMHIGSLRSVLAATAFAAVLCSAPAHANLVVNGGFETGSFSGWTASTDPTYDGVDNQNPQDGSFAAFFGGSASTLRQTLATVAGTTYNLSFWLGNEADVTGVAIPNQFHVDFAGLSFGLTDVAESPYQLYQYSVVANAASTDLVFSFSHSPAFWDFDSVSVDAEPPVGTVPEPSSFALAGLAALALVVTRRRRGGDARRAGGMPAA